MGRRIQKILHPDPYLSDISWDMDIYIVAIKEQAENLYRPLCFITNNRDVEDICCDELVDVFGDKKFYPGIENDSSKPGDIVYFKASNFDVHVHEDYFGEIDTETFYDIEKISKEDIPEEFIKELDAHLPT